MAVVPAQALTNHEYCLQFTRAERMECRAQGMSRRADCIDDLAFQRWINSEYAETDYTTCLAEAKAFVLDCLTTEITDCTTW